MSIGAFVLKGFGPTTTAPLFVLQGFGTSGVPPTPPTPTPGRSGLGGDDVPRRSPHRGWNRAEWKRRVKDSQDAVEQTLRETYASLTGQNSPLPVLAKVDAIVKPAAKRVAQDEPLSINWARIARDYERSNALIRLWQQERELFEEIEDEDEVITLWMTMQ